MFWFLFVFSAIASAIQRRGDAESRRDKLLNSTNAREQQLAAAELSLINKIQDEVNLLLELMKGTGASETGNKIFYKTS